MKRTKGIESWSTDNLPADLWPEILSRLPVRSLLRFRCVSKSWKSLIDDPDFCHLHLNNFKNNRLESHLFVNQYGGNEHSCVVRCNKTFKIVMRPECVDTKDGSFKTLRNRTSHTWFVVCSQDGLVLLKCYQPTLELILWNPSIRRARTLHLSPTLDGEYIELGFGFNPLIKDYKHVRFVPRGENNLPSIAVYTVGLGSWRNIQFQDAGGSNWRWSFPHIIAWKTVCCQGILYFIFRNIVSDDQELVLFDLNTEVFASTSLPVDDNSEYFTPQALALVDGGCSLGLVNVSETTGSIWVLERSGSDIDPMHWTRRYKFVLKICPSERRLRHFLYVKKNGEMLLQWHKRVTSYDLETHEENTLATNGRVLQLSMVCGYIESLILLNG